MPRRKKKFGNLAAARKAKSEVSTSSIATGYQADGSSTSSQAQARDQRNRKDEEEERQFKLKYWQNSQEENPPENFLLPPEVSLPSTSKSTPSKLLQRRAPTRELPSTRNTPSQSPKDEDMSLQHQENDHKGSKMSPTNSNSLLHQASNENSPLSLSRTRSSRASSAVSNLPLAGSNKKQVTPSTSMFATSESIRIQNSTVQEMSLSPSSASTPALSTIITDAPSTNERPLKDTKKTDNSQNKHPVQSKTKAQVSTSTSRVKRRKANKQSSPRSSTRTRSSRSSPAMSSISVTSAKLANTKPASICSTDIHDNEASKDEAESPPDSNISLSDRSYTSRFSCKSPRSISSKSRMHRFVLPSNVKKRSENTKIVTTENKSSSENSTETSTASDSDTPLQSRLDIRNQRIKEKLKEKRKKKNQKDLKRKIKKQKNYVGSRSSASGIESRGSTHSFKTRLQTKREREVFLKGNTNSESEMSPNSKKKRLSKKISTVQQQQSINNIENDNFRQERNRLFNNTNIVINEPTELCTNDLSTIIHGTAIENNIASQQQILPASTTHQDITTAQSEDDKFVYLQANRAKPVRIKDTKKKGKKRPSQTDNISLTQQSTEADSNLPITVEPQVEEPIKSNNGEKSTSENAEDGTAPMSNRQIKKNKKLEKQRSNSPPPENQNVLGRIRERFIRERIERDKKEDKFFEEEFSEGQLDTSYLKSSSLNMKDNPFYGRLNKTSPRQAQLERDHAHLQQRVNDLERGIFQITAQADEVYLRPPVNLTRNTESSDAEVPPRPQSSESSDIDSETEHWLVAWHTPGITDDDRHRAFHDELRQYDELWQKLLRKRKRAQLNHPTEPPIQQQPVALTPVQVEDCCQESEESQMQRAFALSLLEQRSSHKQGQEPFKCAGRFDPEQIKKAMELSKVDTRHSKLEDQNLLKINHGASTSWAVPPQNHNYPHGMDIENVDLNVVNIEFPQRDTAVLTEMHHVEDQPDPEEDLPIMPAVPFHHQPIHDIDSDPMSLSEQEEPEVEIEINGEPANYEGEFGYAPYPVQVRFKLAVDPDEPREEPLEIPLIYLGPRVLTCPACDAFAFATEPHTPAGNHTCCQRGKVVKPPLREPPTLLRYLLTSQAADAVNFRNNISAYNTAMSMATFPGHKALRRIPGRGPMVFVVQGQCYHTIHPADPPTEIQRKSGQFYFLDPAEANERRGQYPGVSLELIRQIHDMLTTVNPHVQAYHNMREVLRRQEAEIRALGAEAQSFHLTVTYGRGVHPGRANLPTAPEVAILFEGEEPPDRVDLHVYPKGGGCRNLNYYDPLTLALTYPLLHPYGEMFHTPEEEHQGENRTPQRNRITYNDSYAYVVHERPEFSPLFTAARVFQKYVVDLYCCVEADNLRYIRQNQQALRSDTLDNLTDYVNNQAARANVDPGRVVILPASYAGSPRCMQRLYLNAMAVVQEVGKPDFFITFTANPGWREIVENLPPGVGAQDRPDLVVKVFYQKLNILIAQIKQGKVLGNVEAVIYSIEFQKRGLPHAHIVVFMKPDSKITSPNEVDKVVKAYVPADADEQLISLISQFMLHGPCGERNPAAPCMQNDEGRCSKRYPMPYLEETVMDNGAGRPSYKRPVGSLPVYRGTQQYSCQNIVPYNDKLLRMFEAHINVEVCTSYKCIKYLFKYIFKGFDALTLHTNIQGGQLNWDEVSHHLNARYVAACEAFWRLCKYKLHYNTHAVILLPIHLPGHQRLTYRAGQAAGAVLRGADQETKLTAWFELNRGPLGHISRNLFYWQIPKQFVWVDGPRKYWKIRERRFDTICVRVQQVSPAEDERSNLRALVMNVRGALSFEWLLDFDNVTYQSYRDACRARHLFQDDLAYRQCLQAAVATRRPRALRMLFVQLLFWATINDGGALFIEFEEAMTQDFRRNHADAQLCRAMALAQIEHRYDILADNRHLRDRGDMQALLVQDAVREQLEILNNPVEDEVQPEVPVAVIRDGMNAEQQGFFDRVMASVQAQEGTIVRGRPNLFYLQGAGGTGKTFTYTKIIQAVKSLHLKCVSMAWTGIASLLLSNGTTCHYALGLPLDLNSTSTSSITYYDLKAKVLREASLILWDEAPMASTHALTLLDSVLQLVMKNRRPFGGKLIILGGDLRQLMPVTINCTAPAAALQHITANPLWSLFTRVTLNTNMRAGPGEEEFAQYIQNVGDGRHELLPNQPPAVMQIPAENIVTRENLLQSVFDGDLVNNTTSRAVLAPTNAAADEVNEEALNLLPGELVEILSEDRHDPEGPEDVFLPVEFMNSLNPPGIPPFRLKLKIGCTLMVLRNIDLREGLCNGTRVRLTAIDPQLLTCTILSGPKAGEEAWIARVNLKCSSNNTPTPFIRVQFPVKLCFAMTINKSQGQTFDRIGLYLNRPVFTHGQMYVALSRVSSMDRLKICIRPTMTQGEIDHIFYTLNIVNAAIVEHILAPPTDQDH